MSHLTHVVTHLALYPGVMTSNFTIADFTVGDNVQAFHPRMLGVVLYGTVTKVGRKYLTVDFGSLRGGAFRVTVADVTQNWGEG